MSCLWRPSIRARWPSSPSNTASHRQLADCRRLLTRCPTLGAVDADLTVERLALLDGWAVAVVALDVLDVLCAVAVRLVGEDLLHTGLRGADVKLGGDEEAGLPEAEHRYHGDHQCGDQTDDAADECQRPLGTLGGLGGAVLRILAVLARLLTILAGLLPVLAWLLAVLRIGLLAVFLTLAELLGRRVLLRRRVGLLSGLRIGRVLLRRVGRRLLLPRRLILAGGWLLPRGLVGRVARRLVLTRPRLRLVRPLRSA